MEGIWSNWMVDCHDGNKTHVLGSPYLSLDAHKWSVKSGFHYNCQFLVLRENCMLSPLKCVPKEK